MTPEPVRLPWDSNHFGVAMARWHETRPSHSEASRLPRWMHDNGIDCTHVLVEADAPDSIRAMEAVGASLTDVRVVLRHDLTSIPDTTQRSRRAAVDDLDRMVEIATESHRNGRFHADGRLDPQRCDALYELWILNSVRDGFADTVLTVDVEQRPGGYVTGKMADDGSTSLSLIAVAPEAQGSGVGRELVSALLHWAEELGAPSMSVVTQGRNVAALRLYERTGFAIEDVALWYHVWREPVAGSNA